MAKIVALDFGTKRIGVAITDDLNIIASGLDTVLNENIISFLKHLTLKNKIQTIVIGKPLQKNNQPSDVELEISPNVNVVVLKATVSDVIKF